MKRKNMILAVVAVVSTNAFAAVTVSDVQVFSGYPWKEVAIGYTIFGKAEDNQWLRVTAKDLATGKTYDCVALDGAKVRPLKLERQRLSEGRHVTMWNASADEAKFKSGNVVFTVEITDDPPLYCAIDLSGGLKAERYEVEEIVGVQHIGWPNEYKAAKLPLRRIEAGTVAGIRIDEPFFIGVFEVTQKQYELVTGTTPSYLTGNDMNPVEQVSWIAARGGEWPDGVPKADSFMGKLRVKMGLKLDLPTCAQWEYAGRAGATTKFSYGDSPNDKYAWSAINANKSTHEVGTRLPNKWGLYDMQGNVEEWCLDCNSGDPGNRLLCGGGYKDAAAACNLTTRLRYYYGSASSDKGFRLVLSAMPQ